MNESVKCPISGQSMVEAFRAQVLGKYDVAYFYCEESGLLKSEPAYWLNEAYHSAISDTDTGLVQRNINNRDLLQPLLEGLGIGDGRFLDSAGGYGLLTRLLRDTGYDCYTTDRYCKNLFARTFEPDDAFEADALFSFEVLEHIEDPLQFISGLFTQYGCRTMIFSTQTFSGAIPPRKWWYYAFDTGQHITFYQPRTLALMAQKLGCQYHMLNPRIHLITDIPISGIRRALLFNSRLRKLYAKVSRSRRKVKGLTTADHRKMKQRLQEGAGPTT